MFKGLSQRAQRLLTILGQEEAKRSNADQLLPEHIMLALIKAADGKGFNVLQNTKVNLLSLQLQLEQSISPRSGSVVFGDIPPSRRLRGMLDAASIEARSLRHDYIGTEHLLLACIRESQSITSLFFEQESVLIDEIRQMILEITGSRDLSIISRQKKDPSRRIDNAKECKFTL